MNQRPTFDELIKAVQGLPEDQQAKLVEAVGRDLAMRAHERLVNEVCAGREECRRGGAVVTSIKDLIRELAQ